MTGRSIVVAPRPIRRMAAMLTAVLAAGLSAGAAPAQAPSHTIVASGGDIQRIGKLGGRLRYGDARTAFGRPSSVRAVLVSGTAGFNAVCDVRWSRLHLQMAFSRAYVSKARCDAGMPMFEARIRGSRFRTEAGLRVGDSSKALREKYPSAPFQRNRGYYSLHDVDGGVHIDRIEAYVRKGKVASIVLDIN